MNWRVIPFVRLLFPFVSGIILGEQWGHGLSWQYFPCLIVIGGCLWLFNRKKISYGYRWIFGSALSLFLLVLGMLSVHNTDERTSPSHFQQSLEPGSPMLGTVLQSSKKGSTIRLLVTVSRVRDSLGKWSATQGRLLIYISEELPEKKWQPGARILFKGIVRRINASSNPKAFDYRRYMHFRNVHYQLFLKDDDWQLIRAGTPGIWHQCRSMAIDILKKKLGKGREFSVAAALILGYKEALQPEVKAAYADTGAIHVLAVSGLHVGIIYLFFRFVLAPFRSKNRFAILLRLLLPIAGIWFYALLTGGAPSVQRAASMFSFILVGQTISRSTNIYNTLSASAFCLLFFSPYLLWHVGFQLSYLAVTGIIYFQPKIYRSIYFSSRFPDAIWKLTSVSLAAQISTLPLGVYYFHQIPTLFWLSGLIVVPAAGIILGSGLLLIVTSSIPLLGSLLSYILYSILWVVNTAVVMLDQIPGGLISDLWLSPVALILIYCLIIFLITAFETRNFRWILFSLGLLSLLLFHRLKTRYHQSRQLKLVIYHLPHHSAWDIFEEHALTSVHSKDIPQTKLAFATKNCRLSMGARKIRLIHQKDSLPCTPGWCFKRGILQIGKIRCLFLDHPFPGTYQFPVKIDYLIIQSNPDINISMLMEQVSFETLVIDSSNNFYYANRLKKQCKQLAIPCINTYETGGIILDCLRNQKI